MKQTLASRVNFCENKKPVEKDQQACVTSLVVITTLLLQYRGNSILCQFFLRI